MSGGFHFIINLTILECKYIAKENINDNKIIINLTILECKFSLLLLYCHCYSIINLTILECKFGRHFGNGWSHANNKSNHIGM